MGKSGREKKEEKGKLMKDEGKGSVGEGKRVGGPEDVRGNSEGVTREGIKNGVVISMWKKRERGSRVGKGRGRKYGRAAGEEVGGGGTLEKRRAKRKSVISNTR